MPGSSLLAIFRSKKDGRRSSSSPPSNRDTNWDRDMNWEELPHEYRPAGQLGVKVLNSQLPIPQIVPPVSQSIKVEVLKMNRHSSIFLQLPPPRARWRRSLEDLSPTKRTEWFNIEDSHRKQTLVDIACAMPPAFSDMPPEYSSVHGDNISPIFDVDRLRAYTPKEAQATDFESFRQQIARMPTFTPTSATKPRRFTETELVSAVQEDSPDMTVDKLLAHPMLRTPR